jgi:hypothetical protein
MRAWLRTLLICLLALAVPLHGWAAVVMGVSATQRPAAMAVAPPGDVDQTDKADKTDRTDCPHHRAVAAPTTDDVQTVTVSPADGHNCGACSVCGTAGAMLPTWPALMAAEHATPRYSCEVQGIATFASSGPDRPPRHIVA